MVGLMIGGRVSIFFFLVDAWQGKARMPLMEKREREGTSDHSHPVSAGSAYILIPDKSLIKHPQRS